MDLKQAKAELEKAVEARAHWNKKVQRLRELILSLGGDPDEYKTQLAYRNEEIYSARLSGFEYKDLATLTGLSVSRIREICQQQQLKASRLYKALLGGADN